MIEIVVLWRMDNLIMVGEFGILFKSDDLIFMSIPKKMMIDF